MHKPVIFDEQSCNGCNLCVDICPMDVLAPNPEKKKPPIVMYPNECYYDGVCWGRCPYNNKGAIKVVTPLSMRVPVLRSERSKRR